MSVERGLIHTCTIQRATITKNDLNEEIKDWTKTPHLNNVKCRLMRDRQQVALADQSMQWQTIWKMILPAGTDVLETDRIVDVLDRDGATVEAGAFDIEEILPRRDMRTEKLIGLRLEKLS